MGIVLAILGELRRIYGTYKEVLDRVSKSPGIPVKNSTRSFWMDPPARVARHQSELPVSDDEVLDVVILGSGISGLSVARTLLNNGKHAGESSDGMKILMLEAREACSGATGRNGGHIWPAVFDEYVLMKKKYGQAAAEKMVHFRAMHLNAYREAVEHSSAPKELKEACQLRDVEAIEASVDPDVWEGRKRKFREWQADMPNEAAAWTLHDGPDVAKTFRIASHCCGAIVGSKAAAMWPYRFVTLLLEELLQIHPNRFFLQTRIACEEISKQGDIYALKLSSGKDVKTRCVVHATNSHVSHLLPKMRLKIIPVRAAMSAQRPGQGLNASTLNGKRSYTLIGASNGFDYMTQLPTGEHELMFGGGIGHDGKEGLAEIGIAQDSAVNNEIAGYLNGALSSWFGLENWGAEAQADTQAENTTWYSGRTKAIWSGTIGWSADGIPWVGRVPDKISGRATSQSTKVTGEWITAGFTGEGMTSAWMCGRALGLMMLVNDPNLELEWLPSQLRMTERRWRTARLEDQLKYGWGH